MAADGGNQTPHNVGINPANKATKLIKSKVLKKPINAVVFGIHNSGITAMINKMNKPSIDGIPWIKLSVLIDSKTFA